VESNADDHEPRCVETTAPHVHRTLKIFIDPRPELNQRERVSGVQRVGFFDSGITTPR